MYVGAPTPTDRANDRKLLEDVLELHRRYGTPEVLYALAACHEREADRCHERLEMSGASDNRHIAGVLRTAAQYVMGNTVYPRLANYRSNYKKKKKVVKNDWGDQGGDPGGAG